MGFPPVQPGSARDSSSVRVGGGGEGRGLVQRQPLPCPGTLNRNHQDEVMGCGPPAPRGQAVRVLAQGLLPTTGARVGSGREEEAGLGLAPRLRGGPESGGHRPGGRPPLLGLDVLGCTPLPRSFRGWGGACEARRAHHRPPEGLQGQRAERRQRGGLGELTVMLSARETLSLERGGPAVSCVSLQPGWDSPEGAGSWAS